MHSSDVCNCERIIYITKALIARPPHSHPRATLRSALLAAIQWSSLLSAEARANIQGKETLYVQSGSTVTLECVIREELVIPGKWGGILMYPSWSAPVRGARVV